MSHGDKVTELPAGFKVIASNDTTPIAAMADEDRKFYAVQFHPEVTHTKQGDAMLQRFAIAYLQYTRRLDHGRLHRGGGC
jgi:GMP synthase (glutamine-hydrolysing)